MFNSPYIMARPSTIGGFSSFIKGINWGGILDGTQKTLGIINQAIPVVYQVKPIISNAKTVFKIAGSLRDNNSNNIVNNHVSYKENDIVFTEKDNKPIFYL